MKIKDIVKATGGKLIKGNPNTPVEKLSIDSRTIPKDALFIAIKGERFDGHDFIKKALKKGAIGVIVSKLSLVTSHQSPVTIQVKDTIKALGDIARHRRVSSKTKVIAITGSNGKTTTKDILASILKKNSTVLSTRNNENNNIGLPLTMLRLKKEKFCVLEMGMNHFGEIEYLTKIALPDIGVITNIGPSHLEYLGSIEDVFKAKCELIENMDKGKILVIGGDDPYLNRIKKSNARVIKFGLRERNDFKATSVRFVKGGWNFDVKGKYNIRLNLLGRHNIYNALAAVAVGEILGLKIKDMQSSIKRFKPVYGRLELKEIKGIRIIDDTYNSNPASLNHAIEALTECETHGKRILVSGDMLELGETSKYFHESVAGVIKDSMIDMLITVGKNSRKTYLAAKKYGIKKDLKHFDKAEEAGRFLKNVTRRGDLVLVKGSRAMKMEGVIGCFTTSSTR
ncbi:MAG: UDP-N-acetylmuramoyl-tripeptide--D-alanyl-D-alanine ligase [Candidatus Omnitrophica bacterium CG07_land_8_20_14_0_80_42_15]|uniref:UDP-N-acetylmuramoyl-tripeptide--D-alanyl-D-alanine ligase n=1 Tax=Candidatus Aquitaenariimonas noxiae TaxID=1974741 RepID=A0A2J0KV14_9BACT|nr:MAG: UDP-N-acetylmuramoyl-tripeptide--D-alanyl-D-alanine ligase [Candidatus Omnitrophica bacterium CG07_land_8_20_14_0_80_42_15]